VEHNFIIASAFRQFCCAVGCKPLLGYHASTAAHQDESCLRKANKFLFLEVVCSQFKPYCMHLTKQRFYLGKGSSGNAFGNGFIQVPTKKWSSFVPLHRKGILSTLYSTALVTSPVLWTGAHGRRRDFFQGEEAQGFFFQSFFRWELRVVKFVLSHSKLRKNFFC